MLFHCCFERLMCSVIFNLSNTFSWSELKLQSVYYWTFCVEATPVNFDCSYQEEIVLPDIVEEFLDYNWGNRISPEKGGSNSVCPPFAIAVRAHTIKIGFPIGDIACFLSCTLLLPCFAFKWVLVVYNTTNSPRIRENLLPCPKQLVRDIPELPQSSRN